MKTLIKTSIAILLCLYCAIASATNDARRLAEEIMTETKFDVYLKASFHTLSELDKAGYQNFEGLKEGIVNNLVEKYSEQQLREIKKIFANERIKQVFIAYYAMWTSDTISPVFAQNIKQLVQSIEDPKYKAKYIKHKHYGKKESNDPILNMLKIMDGLKGKNAVEAYKPWAQNKKDEIIEEFASYPIFEGHEKNSPKFMTIQSMCGRTIGN
jgi:hypothetical protein